MPKNDMLLNEAVETVTIPKVEYDELVKLRDTMGSVNGWLITTRNPLFSGENSGVYFRGGRAFIPDSVPGAEEKAKALAIDFGYTVEHVDGVTAGVEFINALVQPASKRLM